MGQWYELAVVSTCPHYMQDKRENPVIVALDLQHVTSERNFTMTATSFRSDSHQWQHTCSLKHGELNVTCVVCLSLCAPACRNGTCKQTSTVYGLTDLPGKFFHHVASMFYQLSSSFSSFNNVKPKFSRFGSLTTCMCFTSFMQCRVQSRCLFLRGSCQLRRVRDDASAEYRKTIRK